MSSYLFARMELNEFGRVCPCQAIVLLGGGHADYGNVPDYSSADC